MKKVTYKFRQHGAEFSHLGYLAPGISAPPLIGLPPYPQNQ